MKDYKSIIDNLSLEDLAGQVLCYDIYDKDDPKEVEKIIKRIKPGGLFLTGMTREKIKLYTDMVNKYTKVPVIIASDIENGPEIAIKNTGYLPQPMAWGACDDEKLIYKAGVITGEICRNNGVHWTFSPIIDLNLNFESPETNIRAISDSPSQVIKIAAAYIEGLQSNQNMVACCKHFPGQGADNRNSHFVTTLNNMTKEEWMKSFGKIYKYFIDKDIPSIMVGHGSLACFEKDIDEHFGPLPAVLSKSLMIDLLKNKLGFKGLIVSDAMSMIGVMSRVEENEMAIKYLNAGGDVILFPEPTDYDNIIKAAKGGTLPIERLKDAAARLLRLKDRVNLLDDNNRERVIKYSFDFKKISQEIADKSIKVVRDYNNVIGKPLKPNSKILVLGMTEPNFKKPPTGQEFDGLLDEFKKHGIQADLMYNPKHTKVKEIMNDYEMVVLAIKMSSVDYHGATMRIGWDNIMVLWRGYVLRHPKFICVSFGDPYKLYDMPYLKEYINAFSFTESSQRAVAKVLLGEIEPQGKNPIQFQGYFDREV